MSERKTYTFEQVLDRLMLTDEEVLLCKQHREYTDKLEDMFSDHPRYNTDARDFRIEVDSIGNIEEKPKDMWSWYKDGGYYGA